MAADKAVAVNLIIILIFDILGSFWLNYRNHYTFDDFLFKISAVMYKQGVVTRHDKVGVLGLSRDIVAFNSVSPGINMILQRQILNLNYSPLKTN